VVGFRSVCRGWRRLLLSVTFESGWVAREDRYQTMGIINR
jgi:hypothetical protein